MYKVMIVDDEKPARELLKMALDWEKAGFRIIGEALDGQEAFEMFEKTKPDLIITDIQMPVMDGIELIRKVKGVNPSQKFVILSCHESFSYAKQAMKLGAKDYLIKDTYTSNELYATLKNVIHEEEEYSKEKEEKIRSHEIQEDENCFRNIAQGRVKDTDQMDKYFQEKQRSCFIACLSVDDFKYNKNAVEEDIRDLIYTALSGAAGGLACYDGSGKFLVFASFCSSHSLLETMNIRYNILQNVKGSVEKYLGGKLTLGVSQTFYCSAEIAVRTKEARDALNFSVFLGKGKILYYEAVRNNEQSVKVDLINQRFETIRKDFESKNYAHVMENMDRIYKKDLPGMMQCHYLHHINTLLLGLLTLLCSNHKIPYREVFGQETISLQEVEELETVAQIHSWFVEKFNRMIYLLEHQITYSPRVRKIIEYMQQNYETDMGIEDIADEFGLHKVHLSRVFKEETGKSPNTYLNEIRIEKAKEMLKDPNIKIHDIIYGTGFNNPQSFYYIFKQVTGKTPGELRLDL